MPQTGRPQNTVGESNKPLWTHPSIKICWWVGPSLWAKPNYLLLSKPFSFPFQPSISLLLGPQGNARMQRDTVHPLVSQQVHLCPKWGDQEVLWEWNGQWKMQKRKEIPTLFIYHSFEEMSKRLLTHTYLRLVRTGTSWRSIQRWILWTYLYYSLLSKLSIYRYHYHDHYHDGYF